MDGVKLGYVTLASFLASSFGFQALGPNRTLKNPYQGIKRRMNRPRYLSIDELLGQSSADPHAEEYLERELSSWTHRSVVLPVDRELAGAFLRDAYLVDSDLYDANLDGADLEGADLTGADLRRARMQEANLWGATLRNAKLQGAVLTGANLYLALLKGARYDRHTQWPAGFDPKKRGAIQVDG
jgi:pentapeptide repeat protein